MNQQNENIAGPSQRSLSIRDQWDEIGPLLPDVSACLKRESEFATGAFRIRLERLISFLEDQPDCDDALENHDAMAMLLPLMDNRNPEQAVRKGVSVVSRNSPYRRNWVQLFWYPGLVMLAALIVGTFLSVWVEPELRNTMDEIRGVFDFSFGPPSELKRPIVAQLSAAVAAFLRQAWPMILIALLTGAIGGVAYNRLGRSNNRSGFGWWDDLNISVRGALAMWAGHVSTLLKAGIGQTEAFAIASKEAPKQSLRKLSDALAARDAIIKRDASATPDAVDPQSSQRYFPLKKYTLLDEAFKHPSTSMKTAALDEVAFYYRTRDEIVSTWWLSWVSVGMLWGTGLVVLLFVLPLFYAISEILNLASSISGLSN